MTNPTPAPEPMGGPDFDTPLADDELWEIVSPPGSLVVSRSFERWAGSTIAAMLRASAGIRVRRVRLVPSTHTAPPSAAIESWRDALDDAVGALRYIEQNHGRLYGVGFDRVYAKHDALSRPAPPAPGGRKLQVPACDKCSVGVMDATNQHLLGTCECACHADPAPVPAEHANADHASICAIIAEDLGLDPDAVDLNTLPQLVKAARSAPAPAVTEEALVGPCPCGHPIRGHSHHSGSCPADRAALSAQPSAGRDDV